MFEGFVKFLPVKVFYDFYELNLRKPIMLLKSFCTAKYDAEFNLEAFETLGDSVLKLLTVFYIFVTFDQLGET